MVDGGQFVIGTLGWSDFDACGTVSERWRRNVKNMVHGNALVIGTLGGSEFDACSTVSERWRRDVKNMVHGSALVIVTCVAAPACPAGHRLSGLPLVGVRPS